MKNQWFHSSPRRFTVGTLLHGFRAKKNYKGSGEGYVFITNSEIPHFTIAEDILSGKKGVWHVYEVQPHGKIEFGNWDDGLVPNATVLRYVGTARGVLNRLGRNTNPRKPKIGSIVVRNSRQRAMEFYGYMKEWQRRIDNTKKDEKIKPQ